MVSYFGAEYSLPFRLLQSQYFMANNQILLEIVEMTLLPASMLISFSTLK